MVHIVVDLEMNRLDFKYENERKISTNEVIEIGAIAMNEKFEEIGVFKMYVKPQFNDKVVKKVEKLTGITMDMLQDSPVFADAFDAFIKWCISFGEEVVMYGWSDSDELQLRREMKLKSIQWNEDVDKVFRQWHDFQKEFSDLVGIGRIITLSQAVDYAGIDFAGQKHDACCDARNTAYLLALTKDEKRFAKTMKSVLEAFNHEELTSSIGSLIDFSAWNGVGA